VSAPVCPRCLGFIPSNARPGQYPGALSRADNRTEVCSDCGTEEALELLVPVEAWPIATDHREGCENALSRAFDRLVQNFHQTNPNGT